MHSGSCLVSRYYLIRRCTSAILYCFLSPGYRLSPQAMNCIVRRYSTQGKITFDDYVACCVKLRSLTGTLDNFYIIFRAILPNWHFYTVSNRFAVFHWHIILCSDIFRRRDPAQGGTASFQYDDVSMTVLYKR